MPAIKRSTGTTRSERYLASCCDRSFLRLWSYPNLFRDQGQKDGKGDGKEICDLILVFGHHIILFSDKSSQFADTGDVLCDWKRWFKKSIRKSANQVYGAERWIRLYPNRLYLDKACTQRFPIPISHPDECRFHRIVVALNSSTRCNAFFGHTTNGSLIVRPTCVGDAHFATPFCIGQIDPNRDYVHVLDDYTLNILLEELDTIKDFVEYLTKKESLITSARLLAANGEEELLAYYLTHSNVRGEHDFVLPTDSASLLLTERMWEQLEETPEYSAKKVAELPSYFWDALLEDAIDLFIEGHPELEDSDKWRDCESALRIMAGESRLARRALGSSFIDLQEMTPPGRDSARVTRSGEKGKVGYVFMILPRRPRETNETYDDRRVAMVTAFGFAAKQDFPEIEHIVGIAIEPVYTPGGTCRIVYQDASMLPPEAPALAKRVREFFEDTIWTERRELEFPEITHVTPGGTTLTLREKSSPNRKLTRASRPKAQPRAEPTAIILPSLDDDAKQQLDDRRRQLLHARKIFEETNDERFSCFILEKLTSLDRERGVWADYKAVMTDRLSLAKNVGETAYLARAIVDLARLAEMPIVAGFDADDILDLRKFSFQKIKEIELFLRGRDVKDCRHELAEAYYRSSLPILGIERRAALRWARTAVKLYRNCDLQEQQAHAFARLGRIHAELGNYSAALRNYKISLGKFRKIGSSTVEEIRKAIEVCKMARRAYIKSQK